MKTTELISRLQESLELNGDLDVVIITNGKIYEYVDTNVADENSPLYLEGCDQERITKLYETLRRYQRTERKRTSVG